MRLTPVLLYGLLMACVQPVCSLTLVDEGQPQASIVVPDEMLPVVQYAAQELQYHVQRASGTQLPIVPEREMPNGPVVLLGECVATIEAGILPDELEPNEWVGKLDDDRLYLVGDDSEGQPAWVMHANRTRVGTLFAVYELLERELGVRWLWPGELGEVIPAAERITIEQWDDRGTPAFVHTRWRDGGAMLTSVDGWSSIDVRSRFMSEQGKWMRRNRFAMGRNMDMAHAFTTWWDKHAETHPEYFNLLPDDTRRSDPSYHGGASRLISMSVGNANFQQAVVEHWLATRTPAKPWIDCSENDTPGKCMCEDCMALDEPDPTLDFPWEEREQRARAAFEAGDKNWYQNLGAMSDRYARYYLAILEQAREHDPEAVVMGYAYANTVNPPQNTQLNPSVIIGVVPPMYYPWTDAKRDYNRRQWEGWSATGSRMFLRPNWMLDGHNMPLFLARKLGTDFKFYADHGLIGIDFDSLTGQYSTQGPNLYMLARLQGKPEMSVEEVLDEFYAAFGPAEQAVRDYFDHWETVADGDYGEQIAGNHWSYFYRQAHVIFTPEVMARGRELLELAVQAAQGDALAKQRVGWLRKGLRNAELVLATQRAYVGYREQGDFDDYLAALGELDEYRLSVEEDLIGNLGFLYANERRTWDLKLVAIMKQPGTRIPDPWKFAWDPDATGEDAGWWADDFDASGWTDMKTDGPWEYQPVGKLWRQEHNNEDYNGLAWYRTSFMATEGVDGARTELVFGAVDEACTVWVNGRKLLERPYPYLGNTDSWQEAFEVDISEVVRYDRPNTVAALVSDNSGAGGIWRAVWLNQVAPAASDEANLLLDGGFEGKANGWGRSAMSGKFSFAPDTAQAHSGESSGRIECAERGTPEQKEKMRTEVWGRWHQTIEVSPEKSYRLRLWVRTAADFRGKLAIWVTPTPTGTNATNLATTNGRWHEVIVEGIRPKNEKIGVLLNLMDEPGVAWFDDVELVEE